MSFDNIRCGNENGFNSDELVSLWDICLLVYSYVINFGLLECG